MKNLILLFCLALVVFLFFACKTKQYTLTDYPGAQISFGSGGGITGMYNRYILFENGQLFKKSGNDSEFTPLPAAKKNAAQQVFKNYEVLGLQKMELNEPGNMSYYVEYQNGTDSHKLTWGGTNQPASDELKLFYQLLNQLVKSSPSDASKS